MDDSLKQILQNLFSLDVENQQLKNLVKQLQERITNLEAPDKGGPIAPDSQGNETDQS